MELKSVISSCINSSSLCINRTFMELKFVIVLREEAQAHVSIEPLWNWNNTFPRRITFTRLVSIEPLWNWNHKEVNPLCAAERINRTFMELKFGTSSALANNAAVSIEPLWNWNSLFVSYQKERNFCINRTFMELKYRSFKYTHSMKRRYQSNLYGIEILFLDLIRARLAKYQSNLYGIEIRHTHRHRHTHCHSINRTFMELKYTSTNWTTYDTSEYQSNLYGIEISYQHRLCVALGCINRTFMELKYREEERKYFLLQSINRTFMELKCWQGCSPCSLQLGINRTFMELKYRQHEASDVSAAYQSNLYGIEILYTQKHTEEQNQYQSNLYGIEIDAACACGWREGRYQSNLYGIEMSIRHIFHVYPSSR